MCYSGDFINSPEQEEETIEMVRVDRHVPIASEALKKMLGWTCYRCPPMSAEARRLRRMRTDAVEMLDVLNPDAQEAQDNGYSTQVSNHESIFPFSVNPDNIEVYCCQ